MDENKKNDTKMISSQYQPFRLPTYRRKKILHEI